MASDAGQRRADALRQVDNTGSTAKETLKKVGENSDAIQAQLDELIRINDEQIARVDECERLLVSYYNRHPEKSAPDLYQIVADEVAADATLPREVRAEAYKLTHRGG